MERPDFVPQWAWEDYLSVRTFYLEEGDEPGLSVIDAVMNSADCGCVWEGMGRRRNEPAKRWRETMRVRYGRDFSGVAPPEPLGGLLDTIVECSKGPKGEDGIAAVVRRSRGATIARLAKRLAIELDGLAGDLSNGDGDVLPALIEATFQEAVSGIPESLYVENQESFERAFHDEEMISEAKSWMFFSLVAAGWRLPELLTAIAEGAEEWGDTKPPIAQLSAPNAARLYFMRRLTSFFRRNYGTPLREQVAAITRTVYLCEMDAATVAKLAP